MFLPLIQHHPQLISSIQFDQEYVPMPTFSTNNNLMRLRNIFQFYYKNCYKIENKIDKEDNNI